MITKFEMVNSHLIYASLIALAIGLMTSVSVLALSHIFIAIPCLYYLSKVDYKRFSKSSIALLLLAIVIVLSVLVNQDVAVLGFKPISKSKYFFFGFLMIAPFTFYFKNHFNNKKIKILLYLFCISSLIATISGYIGMKTGYNFLLRRGVALDRNAGLTGHVLNYAHNLASFQIIIFGLILYHQQIKEFISKKFLIIVFIINLFGIYTSYTRGALLALMLALPFYFFKKNKKNFLIACAAIGFIGLSVVFVAGNTIIRPGSDNERVSQWQAAAKAFEERPILGYGFLNFEQNSLQIKKRYSLPEPNYPGHAHNNFMEILATTGIVGFICFIAWIGFWLKEMYLRDDIIAKVSFVFIIVFLASGMTQSTISLGVNLFFIMAVYALSQVNPKLLKVQ